MKPKELKKYIGRTLLDVELEDCLYCLNSRKDLLGDLCPHCITAKTYIVNCESCKKDFISLRKKRCCKDCLPIKNKSREVDFCGMSFEGGENNECKLCRGSGSLANFIICKNCNGTGKMEKIYD